MGFTDIALRLLELGVRFIPSPKPPHTDFNVLRQALPDYGVLITSAKEKYDAIIPQSPPAVSAPQALLAPVTSIKEVATSCLACSRSHLTTIAGALDESLRFARDKGVMDPEVVKRIDAAEKEIVIMERIDLSPEAIQNSPAVEQEFVRPFLPEIRKLRQGIGQIRTVEQLESVAAAADTISRNFKEAQMKMEVQPGNETQKLERIENRLTELKRDGYDLNPVISLARKVQKGEITLEDARRQVKSLLPDGFEVEK